MGDFAGQRALMTGLFSDVRNTALAAGGLLVLAVLFVDPSGVGGKAVKADEEAHPERSVRPAQAPSGWFSAGEPEPEPVAVSAAGAGPPPPQVASQPDQIHLPGPVGADFPPGLAPRPGGG